MALGVLECGLRLDSELNLRAVWHCVCGGVMLEGGRSEQGGGMFVVKENPRGALEVAKNEADHAEGGSVSK